MQLFTKLKQIAFITLCCCSATAFAQVSFLNANAKLSATNIHSGCPVGVVDVNGDGLDDIVRLDQAHLLYIDYQYPGLQFNHTYIGDFGGGVSWAWGLCVADVDHNGYKDIVAGGYGPSVKIFKLNSTGTGGTLYSLPSSNFFLQNVNFADINNDGWEDIFGCDDNAESHIWLNNGSGNYTVSSIIDFDVTNTDDSGNYGSVWTDFDSDGDIDLYIAKCRQAVNDPTDGRRIDVLFVNDGSNNYTSNAAAYGLADSAQTWTANFGDIDNDGDLDVIQTDYDVPAKLLENDGTGHMTNISAGSGFNMTVIPIESVMEDFDNDGFVDILVSGSDYQFFHNDGDQTFTKLPGIFGTENMESFAIGDLNHDGKIDVYASYANIYTTPTSVDDIYWLNTSSNGNHFITLTLTGTASNAGALGARATLYGAWGKQVREVKAGESYGTCNTGSLHFGTGTSSEVDSIIINWPSGAVTSIFNPSVDQFMDVIENECVTPDLTISNNGGTVICSGETVTLTAASIPSDYSYIWSNGATTQSIEVGETGDYSVKISAASNDCFTTSRTISITQNPVEVPVVAVSGELTFCAGESVELTAPAAASYSWSNGAATQSITVTSSGEYTVSIPGTCQFITSEPLSVNVLNSPVPVASDVYLTVPGTATLTATGDQVNWYSEPVGGISLFTGNQFITPELFDNTTYYADNTTAFGADTFYTGQKNHHGGLYSGTNSTNSSIIFNVYQPCVLKSVKVYTDTPGERLIEWRNHNGSVIQSALINIPMDSSRITLNFNLVPGEDYELTTNKTQNNILWGFDSPRLQRSDAGVSYPYLIQDFVSLTGSPNGSNLYYYFFDWEVNKIPTLCISDRVPVTVYVDVASGVSSINENTLFNIYPNPSAGMVHITATGTMQEMVKMQLLDIAGKVLLSQADMTLSNMEKIQLDLSTFPRGIYLLNVEAGGYLQQHKLIIQ